MTGDVVGFSVRVEETAGLAALLDRCGDDAAAARRYVAGGTELGWDGAGVLNHMMGGHAQAQQTVLDFLDRLSGKVAHNGADAVRAALRYYTDVDTVAAARLDATRHTQRSRYL